MPKVEKPKKFRAQYLTYGLTYSKCNIDKKVMMDSIIDRWPVVDFYMVRENHDPKKEDYDANFPYHLHCWFNVASKPNFSENSFDFHGKHPNIGKKNRSWVYNYLKKQDKEPYTNIPDGYIALAKAGLYNQALEKFQNDHPKEYVINSLRVDASLRRLSRPERKTVIHPLVSDYEIPGYDWETKSLFLYGPVDKGKTEWVKSYIHHKLKKTFCFVTTHDGFKRYNGEDFIIVDEWNPRSLTREACINLTDVPNPREIKCRHTCAYIPPGVPRIFTSNCEPSEYFPDDPYGSIIPKRVFVHAAPSIRFY